MGTMVACRAPRLPQHEITMLEQARRMSDIPRNARSRIQMQAKRDCDNGLIPNDAVQRHAAARGSRDGSTLSFLLDWARGAIPDAQPQAKQAWREEHIREENEEDDWFNYNELLVHHGGHVSTTQKAYVDKLWKAAKGRPERCHPDGEHVPRQKNFWTSSKSKTKRRRVEQTSVELGGELSGSTPMHQLLDALDNAAGPAGASASSASAQPAEPPVDRATLMAELYKFVPKIVGARDKLPNDEDGTMARRKVNKALEPLQRMKAALEAEAHFQQHELNAGRQQLKDAVLLATKLARLCAA